MIHKKTPGLVTDADTVVLVEPMRPHCVICGRKVGKRHRRRSCMTCYRKFLPGVQGQQLPPRQQPGPPPGGAPRDPLQLWLERFTREQRVKLRGLLDAMEPEPAEP